MWLSSIWHRTFAAPTCLFPFIPAQARCAFCFRPRACIPRNWDWHQGDEARGLKFKLCHISDVSQAFCVWFKPSAYIVGRSLRPSNPSWHSSQTYAWLMRDTQTQALSLRSSTMLQFIVFVAGYRHCWGRKQLELAFSQHNWVGIYNWSVDQPNIQRFMMIVGLDAQMFLYVLVIFQSCFWDVGVTAHNACTIQGHEEMSSQGEIPLLGALKK